MESNLFVYGDEIIAKDSILGQSLWDSDPNTKNNAIAGCGPISQLTMLSNEIELAKNKKIVFVISDVFRQPFNFFELNEEYLATFARTQESLKLLSRELWVKHAKWVPFVSEYFKYVVDVPSEYQQKQLDIILCTLFTLSSNVEKMLIVNRGYDLPIAHKTIPDNVSIVQTNKTSKNKTNNLDEKLIKIIKKWIKS